VEVVDEDGVVTTAPKPPIKPKSPTEVVQARSKSVNRTRTSIRRTVHAMGADALLTLTYRRNETNRGTAFADLARFIRNMREALGQFLYVAVAEKQKRGAIHFHIAVKGWQDLGLIRDCWKRAGGDGNIDVRKWHGPLHRMASYISKYVTKSFTDEELDRRSEHRYRRAQGIKPESSEVTETCDPDHARAAFNRLFSQQKLLGYAQVTQGDPSEFQYFIWGCTWLDEPDPGGEAT
jgi:hypothetical protein